MEPSGLVKTGCLSLDEVLSYRQKGLSLGEIAKLDGTTKQAIAQKIKRSGIDLEGIEVFKKDKALVLHAKQKLFLDALDKKKAEKMTGRDLMVSFGIAFDKTQLLEGRPTATIANLHSIAERAIRTVSASVVEGQEPDTGLLPTQLSHATVIAEARAKEKQRKEGGTDGAEA